MATRSCPRHQKGQEVTTLPRETPHDTILASFLHHPQAARSLKQVIQNLQEASQSTYGLKPAKRQQQSPAQPALHPRRTLASPSKSEL